jgi:hypothetical protein
MAVIIQSFTAHGFQFVDGTKFDQTGEVVAYVTIPAGHDKKPIVVLTDEQYEKLKDDRQFKVLLETKQGGIRIIDSVPNKYKDQVDLLNEVKGQNADLIRKNAQLQAELAAIKR